MSVPLPGWYSSEQERPIGDQLDDGIRGLLIDTHYADRLQNGKVRTYFGSPDELRKRTKADGVSDDTVDAAMRIRDRLGFEGNGERGIAPWYHLACDSITEETPYAFKKVPQLTSRGKLDASCEPNRGPEGAPLFLVNHWITTDPLPLPSTAAKVNAYDPLLDRARDCQRIRNHLPNLVAVNFYLRGELFKVVDTLNGVR